MSLFARLLLVAAVATGTAFGSFRVAQAEAPKIPKNMSQAEYEQLVASISREVVRQLREAGSKTESKTALGAAPPAFEARALFRRAGEVLGSYPAYMARIGAIRADLNAPGGQPALLFLLLLLVAIALALAVERLIRSALARPRERLADAGPQPVGLMRLAALFILDAVPVAALWLVAETAEGMLGGNEAQARLSTLALSAVVAWRFYMLVFRAWLQPGFAPARLVPLDDRGARTVYRSIGMLIVVQMALRSWIMFQVASGTPGDQIGAAMLVNSFVIAAAIAIAIWRTRVPVAAWLAALSGPTTGVNVWKRVAARDWWIGASFFYLASWVALAVGAVSGRLEVAMGLNATQGILVGLLLVETLMWYLARGRDKAAEVAKPREPRIVDVVVKCLRVAVRVAVIVELAHIWLVAVLGLVSAEEWRSLGRTLATAGATVFLAYVIWQILKFQIDRYMARNPIAPAGPGAMDGDAGEAHPQSASRMRTLMPLFRFTLAAAILVLAILIVLTELGVNTAPLIAGASIFGLALSFGSQSLVRDIVSGIFYLIDDAFRVGEYIDTGKAKGTVEGFTLRSIQLRHQNGQIHTIPFGQLGAITNFSRDWIILKFNLRLSLGTDIELVRKTTKKIGQEMMADPDLKKDMIEPLKLQGIADIADNSLVVRFKLTAKPGNPTFVQRQAIKRIYQVFREKGIEFAQATVSVQTLGDHPGSAAAGAAGLLSAPKPA